MQTRFRTRVCHQQLQQPERIRVTTGGNTYQFRFNLEVANASADNGGNVRVYTSNDTLAQKWYIQSNGDGYYRIINVNSGKALDVANAGTDNRANVQQWRSNGSDAQLWNIGPRTARI